MDAWFIAFLVVGLLALISIVAALLTKDDLVSLTAGVFVLVSIFTLFMSTFQTVGAKQIGVPVTFGKPSGGVLHNGWNWKNPVTEVHIFDGSLQTERYSSDKNDAGDPIQVRLFTGSVASVNVTFQWRLADDNSVKTVYLNYKDPQNINLNLVKRSLQQSLNIAFETYNPYAALIAAQQAGQNNPGTQQVAISYTDLQATAMKVVRSELAAQGVQAVSMTISGINYDGNTQHELDALGTAIAQTQVAIQNEKTADAQAAANRTLNASQATGTTLQQLCIQMSQKVLEEGHSLPPGWNCTGASSTTVVPAK